MIVPIYAKSRKKIRLLEFIPNASTEPTADHIFLHCNIHRAPAGIRGLMSVDEDITSCLLNSCPDI